MRHRISRTLTVRPAAALAAGALSLLLLSACTGTSEEEAGVAPADESAPADGSGPAGAEDHDAHAGHADTGKVPVGPLQLPAAEYWSVLQPADGVTQVRAGGCPEDAVCPSFEILTGAALDGVDPAAAHVPDGATCPGGDALAAQVVGEAAESEVEVAGSPATLARWTLSCVDPSGTEVRTVEQLQWYVPDAPDGPVLVVDRWAFEGLESRLAAGGWVSA
ncbi:hypothetical protein [Cellulosimicrobium protaetiae]|uniref:Lipoprotein n=1 Tax=Cellulosimicrobium protaetiae TaxID=2587808 RepID=A0A6M5UEJ9_9MICO|nr:hypothetical protein [Cellulosimicrobium protaetiae]QJW35751.1 hypothetical protein FIC82_005600 [Cellulosimicrobium protaetiae]